MEQRLRATHEQFIAMVDLMERYGDLGRPQQGIEGRVRADRLWREVGTSLNSVAGGVKKSLEKWKKVWADWKTKTKKKFFIIRRGTLGPSGNIRALTSLEKRVLTIMGLSNATEQDRGAEEAGETASHDSECSVRVSPRNPEEPNGVLELFVGPLSAQEIMAQSGGEIQESNALPSSPQSQRAQLEIYSMAAHYEEAYCPKITVIDMNGSARLQPATPDHYENQKLQIEVNGLQYKEEVLSAGEEDLASPEESNEYVPQCDPQPIKREHPKPAPRISETRKIRKRVKTNSSEDRIATKKLEILELQRQHEQIKLEKTKILLDAEIELKKLLIENAKLDIELKKNIL